MARPGLFANRKFRRLARLIGSEALALGHLEFLWATAYETVDDYIGDATDVEVAARWGGEVGQLASALASCGGDGEVGFIEPLEDRPHHFKIHDLWDHAPEYVKKRRIREVSRRTYGSRINNDGRRSADDGGHAADTDRRTEAFRAVQGSSEQSSSVLTTTLTPQKARGEPGGVTHPKGVSRTQWTALFERFWAKYPRKVAKADALKAWNKRAPKTTDEIEPLAIGIATILAERIRVDWRDRPRDKVPYPATFLNRESFSAIEATHA